MNFLAHLSLSNQRPDIQIGNFIGDHVKGHDFLKYPNDVKKGILLHRQIDWFTDHHHLPKQGAERLRIHYGRYSGVVMDVFYDHFLAKNWQQHHDQTLKEFVNQTHQLLVRRYFSLPREVKRFLPFLIFNKRLESYETIIGIEKALSTMSKYTTLPNKADVVIEILINHYDSYNNEFQQFWNEIVPTVNKYIETLDNSELIQPE